VTADRRWLVADIGATNARFSWADQAGLSGEHVTLGTADYTSSDAMLDDALSRLPPHQPSAAALAIAGPVASGQARITNGTLSFDAAALMQRLGCEVRVVNDFHAVARALPHLQRLTQLGGAAPEQGVKAVLGPGSGLGMGLLVPMDGAWRVLASEGGHGDLAPGSPLESEILTLLQMTHGHVSWETALSGPGLVRLYNVVCRLWGVEPEETTPERITSRGVHAEQPVCHQTLEVFFALLGAAAGNLALTVYARGGVYLGGGIVPALADFAARSPLRRRFDERGAMSEMTSAIPLYLILDAEPGLTGALASLRDAAGSV
jgi:glucokinase